MSFLDNHRGQVRCTWRVNLANWSQVAPPSRDFFVRFAEREAAKKRHVLVDETPETSRSERGLHMVWATVLDLDKASDEDLGITWEFFTEDGPL